MEEKKECSGCGGREELQALCSVCGTPSAPPFGTGVGTRPQTAEERAQEAREMTELVKYTLGY